MSKIAEGGGGRASSTFSSACFFAIDDRILAELNRISVDGKDVWSLVYIRTRSQHIFVYRSGRSYLF